MNEKLLTGRLVRLGAIDPEPMGQAFSRWNRDSEYFRLLDSDMPYLWSARKFKEWMEKDLERQDETSYFFSIHTLQDNILIGFIGLFDAHTNNRNAWVAIGLGERDYWGQGYGSDAMRLVLQLAFYELDLYRVSLGVFEYNARAIRSYEKCGFQVEGRQRQMLLRDGQRWDIFIMGILQSDWNRSQQASL